MSNVINSAERKRYKMAHKRFFVRYESNQMICDSFDHFGGNASTIKSAKSIISNIKRELADRAPRNFRIYDSYADVDEKTGFVPCVYEERG